MTDVILIVKGDTMLQDHLEALNNVEQVELSPSELELLKFLVDGFRNEIELGYKNRVPMDNEPNLNEIEALLMKLDEVSEHKKPQVSSVKKLESVLSEGSTAVESSE